MRFKLGDLKGAIADYTLSLERRPDSPQAYSNRALCLMRAGRLSEALADDDRALALRPDHAQTWSDRALLRSLTGSLGPALADYARSLQLRRDPATYLRRATVFGMKGDLDAAVADLDAALSLQPDYPEAYYRRGQARLEQGRKAEGEADILKARELAGAQSSDPAAREEALKRFR